MVAVDSNGNITGKQGGTATITVTVAGDDNYVAPEPQSYTVSVRDVAVTVTGLGADENVGVRLAVGDSDAQSGSFGNGAAQWYKATGLTKDASYAATVTDVPLTKLCEVSEGASGTIAGTTTSLTVTCTERFVKVSGSGADLPSSATNWCAVRDDKHGTTWQAGALATLPGGPGAGTYDTTGNATNAAGHREIANRDALCGARDWVIPQAGADDLDPKAVPPYLIASSTATTETRLCADNPDVPQCHPVLLPSPIIGMPPIFVPPPPAYTVTTTAAAYVYNATIGALFAAGTAISDDPVWLIQGTAQDATAWATLGNTWDAPAPAGNADVAAARLMRLPK